MLMMMMMINFIIVSKEFKLNTCAKLIGGLPCIEVLDKRL